MKEGNVQIILRCKMVCCTPFPGQSLEELQTEKNFILIILDKIRDHDSDSHSLTHLIVTMFSPSKITKNFKYVKQIGITHMHP